MFISAREVNRSIFILLLSQFCNLVIAEKLPLHILRVREKFFSNVFFSYWQWFTLSSRAQTHLGIFFSLFFTNSAKVEGRDSAEVEDHLSFHKSNS